MLRFKNNNFFFCKKSVNIRRFYNTPRFLNPTSKSSSHDVPIYALSAIIAMLGIAYASSPLYKLLCQYTGLGGVPRPKDLGTLEDWLTSFTRKTLRQSGSHSSSEKPIPTINSDILTVKPIKVTFMTTIGPLLPWKFVPIQKSIYVRPGETALVFFTASNLSTTQDITGVSTYSVAPHVAATCLTKIQCFCFEQQRLSAGETVDMPVYFYIDPNIRESHYSLKNLDEITLSYSFFAVNK